MRFFSKWRRFVAKRQRPQYSYSGIITATLTAAGIGAFSGVGYTIISGTFSSAGAATESSTGASTNVTTNTSAGTGTASFTGGTILTSALSSSTNSPPITCTRASPAITYAQNAAGALLPVAANVPRITDLGLLVEESRRNEFCGSALPPSVINWGGIATANYATAPDGTQTATRLQWNGVPNPGYSYGLTAFTNVAGGTYTSSMYVKPNSNNSSITIVNGSWFGTSNGSYTFNFATLVGTASHINGGGNTVTNVSGSATAVGNGWYRLTVTATHSAALSTEFQGGFFDQTGATSGDVNVWGFQCELGSFATSYIPTTSAAVTRSADDITASGALDSTLAASTATLFGQTVSVANITSVTNPGVDGGAIVGFTASVGSNGNGAILSQQQGANPKFAYSNAAPGGGLFTANAVDWSTSTPVKAATCWNGSGRSLVLNGGTVATGTTQDFSGLSGNVLIGRGQDNPNPPPSTGSYINGYIQRIAVWNSRLADAALQALTAGGAISGYVADLNFATQAYDFARTAFTGGKLLQGVLSISGRATASFLYPDTQITNTNFSTHPVNCVMDIISTNSTLGDASKLSRAQFRAIFNE